jgi:predicted TIM-barrel fold metal-dependent hydrolase
LSKARLDPEAGKNYFHFIATLMKDERKLVREFHREYPGVRLIAAHLLMDLEKTYADEPKIDNSDQIERLRKLTQAFPEVVGFVAFDPFRGPDAVRVVQDAIESGAAIGVKFYPPSGYRAQGNGPWPPEPDKKPARRQWRSRYGDNLPEDVNKTNMKLFDYCARKNIPILAHCTPGGFEAAKGYGANSSPQYWHAVLKEYPKLRLCLAHAGGGSSWFSDTRWPKNDDFDYLAWDLATTYENVYLDLSYADEILDSEKRRLLGARLLSLFVENDRPSKLGDKLVWGSDWHMVSSVEGANKVPTQFRSVFQDPKLKPFERQFFALNALHFLDLRSKISKTQYTQDQRDYWAQVLAEAGMN